MAKIRINNLPEGFEFKDGKIVEKKQSGGMLTGDQSNYGLVTTNPSMDVSKNGGIDVRYSLSSVPRDEANIEAEGGETVLTDLNGDGRFGLYDIVGPRHSSGGVPMYLPPQSFVYSDFNQLKMDKSQAAELGVETRKKMTPAKLSKKFDLNEYYGKLKDPYADSIQRDSAELMMDKNKMKLSQLAFMQEAMKSFEDGVPYSSYPYLMKQGIDPIQFTAQVEQVSQQEAQERVISQLPIQQQQQVAALQEYMQQVDAEEPQEAQLGQEVKDYAKRMGISVSDALKALYGTMGNMLTGQQQTAPTQPTVTSTTTTSTQTTSNQTIPSNLQGDVFFGNEELKNSYEQFDKVFRIDTPAGKQLLKNFNNLLDGKGGREIFGKNVTNEQKQKLKDLTDEQKLNLFKTMIKRNHGALARERAGLIQVRNMPQNGRGEYEALTKAMGMDVKDLSGVNMMAGQLGYIAFVDLLGQKKRNELSEDVSNDLEGFNALVTGAADEDYKMFSANNSPEFYNKNLTLVDGIGTNTTWGQNTVYVKPEAVVEKDPGKNTVDEKEEKSFDDPIELKTKPVDKKRSFNKMDWYRQDQMALDLANKQDVTRYGAFAMIPESATIPGVFKDYTAEVNALNASTNTLMDAVLGASKGNSAMASAAKLQSDNAKNIAKTIANTHNYNVNVANSINAQNAQLEYNQNVLESQLQNKLYKDEQALAQRFEAEGNQKRQKQYEALIQGTTNAANSANLETLFPQFDINEAAGGLITFTDGFTPQASPSDLLSPKDRLDQRRKDVMELFPGATIDQQIKLLEFLPKETSGTSSNNLDVLRAVQAMQNTGKEGKEIKKYATPFYAGKVGI